jgi:hypothetical protein
MTLVTVTVTVAEAVWALLPVPSVAVAVIVTVPELEGAVHVVDVPVVGEKLPTAGFALHATEAFPSPPAAVAEMVTEPPAFTVVADAATVIASWTSTVTEAEALPPSPVAMIV